MHLHPFHHQETNLSQALTISNLHKSYKSGTKALNGIDLTVEQGDFFALLGPNGAGKSTTIGIISSLVNKTSGQVKVFDFDLDQDLEAAKSQLGLVPQEFNFNIFEKVLDIVVDAAGYYGIPRSVALPRAETLLKELGLWDKRSAPSRTLSGGMKRRLLIARALVHQPKLLLLDEPSAGVDVELRRGMWEFVKKLNAQGTTIVLTTHYMEEAERLCKNVVILREGAIAEQGAILELIAQTGVKNLEDVYLHVTTRL